ncbi:MAG: FtsQ-type POTRA domain-containing protein [Bauldia sp.]|nr:FtsQ-type POTRA domain-containing protein [Bauldia sp.]
MRSVAQIALERGAVEIPDRLRVRLPVMALPPVLRRPARLLSRIDIAIPRRFGLKATVVLLLATGIYGVILGGHVDAIFGGLTAAAGMQVASVQISGQSETAELDILDALALPDHNSLVTFDAEAARQRVETLPWVASASVRKVYPDRIEVSIVEREAYALWQHSGRVALVDETGHILSAMVPTRYAGLLLVVGAGAQAQAAEILGIINDFPELKSQIRAATLVAGRRWNLTLRNGITVLLPEDDPLPALIQLVSLDQASGLLSRDIVSVDLRLPGRMTVRLDEAGMEAIEDYVDERAALPAARGAA